MPVEIPSNMGGFTTPYDLALAERDAALADVARLEARVKELEGALRDLVDDLELRAKAFDDEDCKEVCVGNGVYFRAREALAKPEGRHEK